MPSKDKIIVTPKDVDAIIQKATTDSFVKILDYKLVDLSDCTLGFSGLHSHLKVKIQESVGKTQKTTEKTLEFFVKSFPYDNLVQTACLTKLSVFDRETFFYNTIVPLFTSNYDIKKWSSACFLTKKDVIVLEDLKSQGYQVQNTLFDNYELLKSTLATVASFHSGSILADAHLNRDSERSVPLNEKFPNIVTETVFSSKAEFAKGWFNGGIATACNVAKYLGKNPEDIREKFKRIPDLIKPSKSHCNVILHSDLWMNNIMFDDSKPPNCVLIDFQTTRYGPMVLDLLQLLHLNSSPAFRAKFENELVDHYHSILEETIRRNNSRARIPTREEIDLGLKEFRLFGTLVACLYVPMVYVDPVILREIAIDEKKLNEIIGGDRTQLMFETFEKDECYKTKVVDAVTELTEIKIR